MTNKTYKLDAQTRDIAGKKVKRLRTDGKLPAIVYGFETDNTKLVLDHNEFWKVYRDAGSNSLIDLQLDKKTIKILIHDVQVDPVRDELIHADLYAVNLKEKVETAVPIKFEGESPAINDLDGNFVANRYEVDIKALPTEIPSEIIVDITSLATFDDIIRAKDLVLPNGVELIEDEERTIAFVDEPRSEEELEAELADDTTAEAEAIEELGAEPEEGDEESEGESEDKEKSDDSKEDKNDE